MFVRQGRGRLRRVATPSDDGGDPVEPLNPRYRCTACGNLTRFDVVATTRTRSFHHYTVGGELEVEDVQVLAEEIEEVSCRWCGSGGAVVAYDAADDAAS